MLPIEDHGVIGDGRSVALVDRNGTVDWLCWPRFDSDPTFAALLHDPSAGAWQLHPLGEWSSAQTYVRDTNVLVTTFEREGAKVSITDLMPVCSEEEVGRRLCPEHELLRIVECTEGEADVFVSVRLAPGFGRTRVRCYDDGPFGLRAETRFGAFFLRGERDFSWSGDNANASFPIRAGERVRFSLSWAPEGPAVLPPFGAWTDAAVERTVRFWRSWAERANYQGPYVSAVRRSALVLKLLQYPPSGAFLAAATTSLPEKAGGPLNWDYRYCWLRDAAFTVRALYGLGYRDEAERFVSWLLHATRLTQPRLAVLYDVFGNSPGREQEVPHLKGYRGARPVRVGNGAERQLQLDTHGELLDAVCAYVDNGGELDRETRHLLRRFGTFVEKHWGQPDASIWEERGPLHHYTHSKVLCWKALDELLYLHSRGMLPKLNAQAIASARKRVRQEVLERAVSPRTGGYVSVLDGSDPDAALLLLSWYGFDEAASPRMRATLQHIRSELGDGGGLIYRTRALRAQGDGAFIACSFWAVELLADGAGSLAQAEAWFQDMLARANPLGLYAEEVDPASGSALGNFPQAYSHVALISAALSLEERRAEQEKQRPAPPAPHMTEVFV